MVEKWHYLYKTHSVIRITPTTVIMQDIKAIDISFVMQKLTKTACNLLLFFKDYILQTNDQNVRNMTTTPADHTEPFTAIGRPCLSSLHTVHNYNITQSRQWWPFNGDPTHMIYLAQWAMRWVMLCPYTELAKVLMVCETHSDTNSVICIEYIHTVSC